MKTLALDTIHCGDATKLLPDVESGTVDCIVTSPPYDAMRDYGGLITGSVPRQYTFPFEDIARQLARALKSGGVLVWVVGAETHDGSESLSPFKQAIFFNEACDLRLHDTMLYEKNGVAYPARPSGNRYTQCFEYMFVFSKGKPKTAHLISDKKNRWVGWKSFGQLTERLYTGELVKYEKDHGVPEFSPRYNIWRYPNEVALLPEDDETLFPVYDEIWKYATGGNFTSSFPLAKRHPACFPESLVIDHLRTWTEESDVVLDPFNGVGTTTVVAAWMNRHFIGIDLSREYCDIAQKRLDPKYRIDIVKRIEQSKRFNNSRYPQDEHRYVGKTRKGSS